MTYQSPRTPEFDPYRGGTAGASTGISSAIARNIRRLLILGALAWVYLYPRTLTEFLNVGPPGPESDQLLRTTALVMGGFLVLIMVIGAIVRTRNERQRGIPRN